MCTINYIQLSIGLVLARSYNKLPGSVLFPCQERSAIHTLKGELRSKISLLQMKVLTLIKAKSNVFL